MQCPAEPIGKLRYNILLICTCKILPEVTVCISDSVMMHLLGSNTESNEFQPNYTGFELVSGANIRFEQIKTT